MNRRKKVAFVWLGISLLSFLAVVSVFLFDINMDDGGGAMLLVGLLFGITGFITFILYLKMAGREKDIVTHADDQLLKWEYDDSEWSKFAADQYRERVKENKATWMLIAVISVVCILPIWFMTHNPVYAVLFVIGLMAFLAPFTLMQPLIQRRRILRSPHTAIVASNGVIIGKELHLFDLKITWLNSVTIDNEYILFNYSAIASPTIVADYNCRIPIKHGSEQDIEHLRQVFSGLEKPPKIIDTRLEGPKGD